MRILIYKNVCGEVFFFLMEPVSVLKLCSVPTGAVPVPVPSRAESGEQPGGPESPAESRNQRLCTTGTD